MNRREALLASCLMIGSLIVSACATSTPPAGTTPVATTEVGTSAEPQGRMTIAAAFSGASLDFTITFGAIRGFEFNFAEALVFAKKNSPDLEPGLAERWERQDPTTWRFYLRRGVTFHNGQPFDAEAVVFSLQRAMNPELQSFHLNFLNTFAAVRKVDDVTVDIVTKVPDPLVPRRMTYPMILAPGQTDEERASKPISTGPYVLTQYDLNQRIVLEANPSYWGQPPRIKEIVFLNRVESSTRAAMIRTGEADFATELGPDDVALLGQNAVSRSGMEFAQVRFTTQSPVLKDVRVRRALVLAIDYESILKLYGEFAGPAYGPQLITSAVVGFNPDVGQYPYDPAESKRLLQEAGAVGAKLTFVAGQDWFPRVQEVGEFLALSWQAVGLDVNLRLLDRAGFVKAIFARSPEEGASDIILAQHGNELQDSSNTMEQWFTCTGRTSTICDPELDRLIIAAGAAEGEERVRLYRQAWAQVPERVPLVGLLNIHLGWGVGDRVIWDRDVPITRKFNLLEFSLKQ